MTSPLHFKILSKIEVISNKEELIQLGIVSYSETFRKHFSEENFALFKKNIADKEMWLDLFRVSECFVCFHATKIVGVAYFIPSGNPWKFFDKEWSYIRLVAVLPEFQGNGIAKRLTIMCIEEAKKRNEKIIALHTSEIQNAARHIYEKMGFKILRPLDKIYGIQYWIYKYSL